MMCYQVLLICGGHHTTVANLAKICLAGFQKIVPHAAMGRPSPIQIHS